MFQFLTIAEEPKYPQKEFFQRNGMSGADRLLLLKFLINTNQVEDKKVIGIFKSYTSSKKLSSSQARYLWYFMEETFNPHYASVHHLYTYPVNIDELKNKIGKEITA